MDQNSDEWRRFMQKLSRAQQNSDHLMANDHFNYGVSHLNASLINSENQPLPCLESFISSINSSPALPKQDHLLHNYGSDYNYAMANDDNNFHYIDSGDFPINFDSNLHPLIADNNLQSIDQISSRPAEMMMMTSAPNTSSSEDSSSHESKQPADQLITGKAHEQSKQRGSSKGGTTNQSSLKKPKRLRGKKLAIRMETDVDIVDDGYKWRKYGQKAVKNSPYPRSYYKCTNKQCKVKKQVERQVHEPEIVVMTYEGMHNHPRPDQQLQVFHHPHNIISHSQESFPSYMDQLQSIHIPCTSVYLNTPFFQHPQRYVLNHRGHNLSNNHHTYSMESQNE